jgi:hypothetical protein
MPSSGGTLAKLAEAGRAERIEPLDANGLSAGDRAIIAELRRLQASAGDGKGFALSIGTIVAPSPVAAASEVVSSLRAESYRMGQFQ